MAILDFLKNKPAHNASHNDAGGGDVKKPVKKPAKVSNTKKVEKKVEKKEIIKSEVKSEPAKSSFNKSKSEKFSYEAIKQPHISEKASYLAEKDQYIFEVSPNYNKHEIKKSVEGIYHVNVLSVNIIRIPAKKRRIGRTEGFRKAYKKAIVTIKGGQKIEIL